MPLGLAFSASHPGGFYVPAFPSIYGAQTLAACTPSSVIKALSKVTGAQALLELAQTSAIHVVGAGVNVSGAQTLSALQQSALIKLLTAVTAGQTLSAAQQATLVKLVDKLTAAQTLSAITQSSAITTASAAWSPASIPGIVFFDPADSATLTLSGANVSAITSKGSKTYTLAPVSGTPTLVASSNVNGHPAIRFPGDGYMGATLADHPIFRALLMVPKVASDGSHCMWSVNNAANDYVAQGYANYFGGGPDIYAWSGAGAGDDAGAMTSAPYVYVGTISDTGGDGAHLWLDGVEGSRYSTQTGMTDAEVTLDKLYLGGGVFTSGATFDFTPMDVAFMGFVTQPLSTSDRQKFEGWASWTYMGDGSLVPTGHPYKNAAP